MDEKPFTATIMSGVGSPNHNGRTYPKDVVEAALVEFAKRANAFGYLQNSFESLATMPAFKVTDTRLDGDQVLASVQLLPTHPGTTLAAILDDAANGAPYQVSFRTVGTGKITTDGVISEYMIDAVNVEVIHSPAVPKSAMPVVIDKTCQAGKSGS